LLYSSNDAFLGQEKVVSILFLQFLEEAQNHIIVLFVEASNLVFVVLVVWHLEHACVIDHTLEDYFALAALVLLSGFVMALEVPHEWLLVPQFQEFGPAVILKCAQVCVNFDIWFH
jgi:hypothetical protein